MHDYKRLSGIYKITNTVNGKFYIGSSSYIKSRLSVHKHNLIKSNHENSYLQRAWNKYGSSKFTFEAIEIVNDVSNLIIREQFWLDSTECYKRNIGYNIRTVANSSIGVGAGIKRKPHSEETKRKISEGNKGRIKSLEERKNLSKWQKGKIPTTATKAAAIINRARSKWNCPDGHNCKCGICKEIKSNYLKQWRINKKKRINDRWVSYWPFPIKVNNYG